MLVYRQVAPGERDFLSLVAELNNTLQQLVSDSGESSYSADAHNPATDACIVVYSQGMPVACGGFRYHAEGVCELKRMYSNLPGAGSYLLARLEACVFATGYRTAVLSTRRINHKAVSFYRRHSPFAIRHSPFAIRHSPFAIRIPRYVRMATISARCVQSVSAKRL